MPGSDPARTFNRTKARLESLGQRSGTLHLFAPEADETGPLRFTPLARELGCASISIDSLLPPEAPRKPVSLIEIADDSPLPPLPSPQITGGARVLKLQ